MQPIMALLADPDSDILLIINMMQGNLRNR
jgi:hypothetical protein